MRHSNNRTPLLAVAEAETADTAAATNLFKLLNKYQSEEKSTKKARLAAAAGGVRKMRQGLLERVWSGWLDEVWLSQEDARLKAAEVKREAVAEAARVAAEEKKKFLDAFAKAKAEEEAAARAAAEEEAARLRAKEVEAAAESAPEESQRRCKELYFCRYCMLGLH